MYKRRTNQTKESILRKGGIRMGKVSAIGIFLVLIGLSLFMRADITSFGMFTISALTFSVGFALILDEYGKGKRR